MNVLLIEDSPAIQKALVMLLTRLVPNGLSVISSDNGKDAFKLLTKNSFDLIITGLNEDSKSSFLDKILKNTLLSKKSIIIYSSQKPAMDLSKTPNIKHVDIMGGMEKLADEIKSLIN